MSVHGSCLLPSPLSAGVIGDRIQPPTTGNPGSAGTSTVISRTAPIGPGVPEQYQEFPAVLGDVTSAGTSVLTLQAASPQAAVTQATASPG